MEVRALLSGFETVNIDSSSPVEIPVEKTKAGQTIPLALKFSTEDTTTPEDPENEWVEIQGSDGTQMTVSGYGSQTIEFPISKDGETISAFIDGADGDESGTITVGEREIKVHVSLAAITNAFQTFADDLEKSEEAIKTILSYSPGWVFYPPSLSVPKPEGEVDGVLIEGPDGTIDGGGVSVDGSAMVELSTQLYWGLPAKLAGVSVTLAGDLGVSVGAKAVWNRGTPMFSGELKGVGSLTLTGTGYLTFFKGFVYGKAAIELPVEKVEDGVAEGPINYAGEIGGKLQYKGLFDEEYETIASIAKSFGPDKLGEWSFDFGSVIDAAVEIAEDEGDPLVVTAQPPAKAVAGVPFGLTITATNPDGSLNRSFNGPVTLSDPGKSDLSGALTVNAVNGVATFAGLSLSGAGTHQLYASSAVGSLYTSPIAVTGAVTIGLGQSAGATSSPPASAVPQFAFTTQVGTKPADWVGGRPLVNPGASFGVTVHAEGTNGALLSSYNGPVTLALASDPSGATLGGTLTVNAVNGIASFSGLSIDKAGSGFALTTASGATTPGTSNVFDVSDLLAISTAAPGSVVAGAPFGLVVRAQDSSGKLDPSYNGNVTVSESNYSGGSTTLIKGTVTVQAVHGVATFSGLQLDQAGYYSLVINGVGAAFTSQLFQVTPGKATQLVVTTPPHAAVTVNAPFSVVVQAQDAYGNVDPTASGQVTLALAGPSGALGGTTTLSLSGGVATFSGLKVAATGAGNVLKASGAGLPTATTSAFDVRAVGVATRLVVTSPGSSLSETAGTAFGLVLKAEDDLGTVDPNFSGTVTLALATNSAGASLLGTASVGAVHGVATFAGLSVDVASSFTLGATAVGMTPSAPASLGVTPGAAAKLVISSPTGTLVTGTSLSTTVLVEDAYGNLVIASQPVTIALGVNPGGATLSGNLTAYSSGGVATFSNLAISKPGSGYTLKVTSGSLAAVTSAPFDVENDRLVVTSAPPSGTAAGSKFGVVVKVEGATGAVDTSFNGQVALSLVSYLGNIPTLSGQAMVTVSNGVAVFTGLSLDQVGSYSLTATAGGATSASTGTFRVAASRLSVETQAPAVVNAAAPFSMTVVASDAAGNVDRTFNGPVTIALAANPGKATLGGTLTVDAINGVATFTGLTLSKVGSGYSFTMTSAGLASTATGAIAVVPAGTATQLVVSAAPPGTVAAGSLFGLTVRAEDTLGNLISSFQGKVTLSDAQGALAGLVTVTAVNGVATFSHLALTQATPFDDLTATAAGLIPADSGQVAVTALPASQLAVTLPLAPIQGGVTFTIQVLAEDPFGNVDPTYNGPVFVALGANPGGATLAGTVTATAVNGVATLSGLSLSRPGHGDTINAAGLGNLGGLGRPFDVSGDRLVFTNQPESTVSAGTPFTVTVAAEDASGKVDTSFNGVITLEAATLGQPLAGTTTAVAVNGVATFAGLTLNQAGVVVGALDAISGPLPTAVSTSLTVTSGAAVQLVVLAPPPAAVTAGAPFEVDVAVEDALGNVVTSYAGNVALSLASTPAGATLGGTLTVAVSGGVAKFSGLSLDGTASGPALKAAAAGFPAVSTSPIMVLPSGRATQLVITTQPPENVAAGAPYSLVVVAEDSFGTPDPTFHGAITLADPSGGAVGGTLTVVASAGLAIFGGLFLPHSGAGQILTANAAGLARATTSPISVSPLSATKLDVQVPTGDLPLGSSFGAVVFAEDFFGNVASDFQGEVTLNLASDPTGATLGGTVTMPLSGGSAFFPALTLDKIGDGYALGAASVGLAASTSPSFAVTSGQLQVSAQPPSGVAAGVGFTLAVQVQDTSGNPNLTYSGVMTATLVDPNGTGASLGGAVTATVSSGVARFSGLTIDRAGTYEVALSGPGLGDVVTSPIAVTPSLAVLTTTTLSSSLPAGSSYGHLVQLTATVQAASATPTGSVQFLVDGQDYGAPVPLVTGVASTTEVALHAGARQVDAVYISGDSSKFAGGRATSPISLAVSPAPLVVTTVDTTRTYGQANPAFSVTYAGFVLGQSVGSLGGTLSFSTTATATSHVGAYSIVPGGLTSADYAIRFAPGVLTVTPAPLTVTAVDAATASGQPLAMLTATYSGFVNGDGPSSLATPVTFTTTATPSSPPGLYPIISAGASSPDYSISFVNGTLTVTGGTSTTTASPGWLAFVTTLFQDILGRTADAYGLNYWLGRLADGTTRAEVNREFYLSAERRQLVKEHTAPKITRSASLADAIRADELASVPPAALTNPGPIALVTTLYHEILNRAPEPSGQQSWLEELAIGTPPASVARDIFSSPEHKTLQKQHKATRISERTALADALKAEKVAVRINAATPTGSMDLF